MQYVFFEKKVYAVYNGICVKTTKSWAVFENFCVKVTLQSVSLLLTVNYRKMGSRTYYHLLPSNFVGKQLVQFSRLCEQ